MRRGLANLLLVAVLAGCSERPLSGPAAQPVPLPHPAADSPLLAYFPELDQRIVVLDPATGAARQILYPDAWDAEAGHVLDLAAGRDGMVFALLASRRGVDLPRLYMARMKDGTLDRTLDLPPWPQNLTWDCAGRLWIGHGTPASGPGGQLSVVDPGRAKVVARISLQGAAVAVAPFGDRALVLERQVRESGAQLFVRSSLAEVDLKQGKVLRRRRLPPGAREASLGPSGRLYVAHASGSGMLATDGTVSVVDRRSLRVVRRLRLGMVVRRIVPTPRHLLLNMLSDTGDVWITMLAPDDTVELDFRVGEPVGPDVIPLGRTLYIPIQRGQALRRVFLDGRGRRPPLRLQGTAGAGRPGLLRTWMSCDGA